MQGITNGTAQGDKAVVTNTAKDISELRNITATGTLTGGSLTINSQTLSAGLNDLNKVRWIWISVKNGKAIPLKNNIPVNSSE